MSATTKKKHVTREVLEEYALPEGERQVVKITASRGNNLHEVETASGEQFLVSMPPKFRKHVWIKRGDFIMIEPIHEGLKVKGEITHILFEDQIKHIQDHGMWPESFTKKASRQDEAMIPDDLLPPDDSDCSDEELGDRVINVNRVNNLHEESESSDSHSDDEEDDEDSENENACENDNVAAFDSRNCLPQHSKNEEYHENKNTG